MDTIDEIIMNAGIETIAIHSNKFLMTLPFE